jgi:hypothetical protein
LGVFSAIELEVVKARRLKLPGYLVEGVGGAKRAPKVMAKHRRRVRRVGVEERVHRDLVPGPEQIHHQHRSAGRAAARGRSPQVLRVAEMMQQAVGNYRAIACRRQSLIGQK